MTTLERGRAGDRGLPGGRVKPARAGTDWAMIRFHGSGAEYSRIWIVKRVRDAGRPRFNLKMTE